MSSASISTIYLFAFKVLTFIVLAGGQASARDCVSHPRERRGQFDTLQHYNKDRQSILLQNMFTRTTETRSGTRRWWSTTRGACWARAGRTTSPGSGTSTSPPTTWRATQGTGSSAPCTAGSWRLEAQKIFSGAHKNIWGSRWTSATGGTTPRTGWCTAWTARRSCSTPGMFRPDHWYKHCDK